jgi:parvulin-like peptidyl-prolyl isomerase
MTNRTARRLLMIFAVVVSVAGLAATDGTGEILEQVIVKVNGEILTKTDLEGREVSFLRSRGQNNLSEDELKKVIAEVTPQVLVDAVDEMLMLQRGRELGYRLSEEQFQEILERIKKENKLETQEQLDAALKQEGLTLAELRKSIERNMILQRVQQNEVMGKISVSEAEARNYYEAHKNEFVTPTSMMIREMLVAVPVDPKGTLNVGKDEEAKAKADALRARAAAGENVETLIAENSEAPSKANGGMIGPIKLDEMDQALRKVFEPLKPGDLTPVLRTTRGYQFFKVESKTEPEVIAFDKARDQIANRVAQTKQRGEIRRFLTRLRGEALIEWKNAELKRLYDEKVAKDFAESVQAER